MQKLRRALLSDLRELLQLQAARRAVCVAQRLRVIQLEGSGVCIQRRSKVPRPEHLIGTVLQVCRVPLCDALAVGQKLRILGHQFLCSQLAGITWSESNSQ